MVRFQSNIPSERGIPTRDRKVLAWDPQLNTMVVIQEDTRLIEYYQ